MRRQIYFTLVAQWISAVLSIVSSVLIARMMLPAEAGIFVVTMALAQLLTTLQTAGLGEYLLFNKDVGLDVRRRVQGVTLLLSAVVCASLVLGGPVWASVYQSDGVADVAKIIAAKIAIVALSAPVQTMLVREQQFGKISLTNLASSLTLSFAQFAFVYSGFSYIGLAYAELLSGIVYTGSSLLLGRRHILFRPSFRQLMPILRYSSKIFGVNAVTSAYAQSPSLLIGVFSGVAGSGLFGRANMAGQVYTQTIARAVDPVVRARIAAEQRDGRDPVGVFINNSRFMLTLSISFFGFTGLTAHLSVPLFLGDQWVAAAPAMVVLCGGFFIWPLNSATSSILLAFNKPGTLFRIRVVNLLFRVSALAALAPFGVVSASAAVAMSTYVEFVQCLREISRLSKISVSDYLRALGSSVLAAVVPLIATAALLVALEQWAFSDWMLLGMASGAMSVTFVSSIAAFDHPLWTEVKFVVRRLGILRVGSSRNQSG